MSPLRVARGLAGGVSTWSTLAPSDRRTFARAWWTLLTVQVSLRLAGARGRRRLARDIADPVEPAGARAADERLLAAFRLAARRHMTSFSCLPRALALRRFLHAHHVDAALRLGVRHTAAGIEGHAWVEIGGAAVHDESAFVGSFVPLRWADARRVEEAR